MRQIVKRLQRHGAASTLFYALVKALELIAEFRILRGVWIERPDPAFLDCAGYSAGFLPPKRLREAAANPATELNDRFIDQALLRGDECYGICDGEKLASYGWYAKGRTPISSELDVLFKAGYVYMYKGFTSDDYRGQRLHAIGMTRALRYYRASGRRGIVSYVEAQNFDSLKSCFRMGYAAFGTVYLLKLFGRWLSFSSPGCRRFGFRVVPTSAPRPLGTRGSAWAK
jgi:hypothetical protein